MIRNIRFSYLLILACLFFVPQYSCWSEEAILSTSVKPVQLRGLKSVFLIAFVDFNIPNYSNIEHQLKSVSERTLKNAGLSLGDEQNATLVIKVFAYHIKDKSLADFVVIQVRTELHEKMIFIRDPKLTNPHGATTWHQDWVELKRWAEVKAYIFNEVSDQIESFCSDWESVAK